MIPLYRQGDCLIVSGEAPIAIGDRVVIESTTCGILDGTFLHRDGKFVTITMGGETSSGLQHPSRRHRSHGASDLAQAIATKSRLKRYKRVYCSDFSALRP